MEKVEAMLAELRKFSSDIATLNGPADKKIIEIFETDMQLVLPDDYKYAMKLVNGFSIMGDGVFGFFGKAVTQSLESTYDYEHFEVQYPQPAYLVPFSTDGGGNFYCFDTRYRTQDKTSCPVVFWHSNYQYSDDDTPEIVNDGFVDFVNDVIIGWTLKEYDYTGNER
jgi:cell wall assembly regulator SMI1